MFAEYVWYYKQSPDVVLNEPAKRFFSMCNSMYKLRANDDIRKMIIVGASFAGGNEAKTVYNSLERESQGNDQLLKEIEIIKSIKKN